MTIQILTLAASVLLPTLRGDVPTATSDMPPEDTANVVPGNDSQRATNNDPPSEQLAKPPVDPRRKAEAKTFLNLLWDGKICNAVDMSPEFRRLRLDDRGKLITDRMKGSDGELRQLSENFRRRVGEYLKPVSFHSRTMADRRILEVRCRWERAVMFNRFLFDDRGRIEGYWLARDPKKPAVESFSADGYMLGVEMCRVAGRCGAIPVRIVQAEGKSPGRIAVTLWTALPKDTERIDNPFLERNMARRVRSHFSGRAEVWIDPQTERRWVRLAYPSYAAQRSPSTEPTNTPRGTRLARPIHSPTRVRSVLFENPYAEPDRPEEYQICFERLLPGEYCVTVCWEDDHTRSSSESRPALADPTSRRIDAKSPILRLDLSKKPEPTKIVVPPPART